MVGAFLVKKGRSGKYWSLFGQGFGLLIDGFDGLGVQEARVQVADPLLVTARGVLGRI